MPRQKFDSSSPESSESLPKANANDNKKQGTSLKRKSQPSSSSDESDSENEQQNAKGKLQQSRPLKQTKLELSTPVKQPKNTSHKSQEQPNKNTKSNEEPKKKQMKNNKMMRTENHAEIDDQHERASSSESINAPNVNAWPKPKEMYNFFKWIIDLSNDDKIHLAGKKANVRLETLLKDQPGLDPNIDLAAMQIVFNKVYRWATLQSETPLVNAINRVMEYVQSESILQRYDCPKPHKMWNIFVARHGKTPFDAGEELKQKFNNKEDIDVKRAEEEYNKSMETYAARLHEYLDQNKDYLFEPQIEHIQKNIEKLEKSSGKQKHKEENGKEKAKGSKRTKKVEKETPFALWKMTNGDKYMGLPEEQRNAKLLKKFNKLDDAQKSIYEKLAEAMNKKQS